VFPPLQKGLMTEANHGIWKTEEDGRTSVTVEHGDFAHHPLGARLAKQVGNSWVEALIRLKERVEHEAAA